MVTDRKDMSAARGSRWVALVLALVGGAACNSLTGADGLLIEDDEGEDVESAGSGRGGESGDSVAAATTGDTSSGAGTTGAGGAPPDPSSSSAGAGPPACQYPAGPYGAAVGEVLPPTLTWQGFPKNASQAGTVAITDYFDCDGSKGINALLLITSATWCGPCQEEAYYLEGTTTSELASLGAEVITLMFENGSGQPATVATAQAWKNEFGLVSSAVVADPEISMLTSSSFATPLEVVVDTRTMKVVDRQEGFAGDYPALISVAQQNQ